MESAKRQERRRKSRGGTQPTQSVQLWVDKPDGGWRKISAQIQDKGEYGIGILLSQSLRDGQAVLIEGGGICGANGGRARGAIAWCTLIGPATYRAGVALDDAPADGKAASDDFEDYYEILEVNPTASFDTIHKIYRVLAHRLHPDNPDSGNEELFKKLSKSYQILSDPDRRAAFDVERNRATGRRWRIFDPESAAPGLEQEQRKRRAILSLLYNKRMRQPEGGGVGIPDLEQMLAVPREHLEFPLWFLREQGWIQRTDGGKFSITAKGVDYAETTGAWQPPAPQSAGLLEAAVTP